MFSWQTRFLCDIPPPQLTVHRVHLVHVSHMEGAIVVVVCVVVVQTVSWHRLLCRALPVHGL